MDINCDSLPNTPIAILVLFACRSKTELRNVIVRDHSKCIYKNFLGSSRLFIIPKVINKSLSFYIYL